jgi:hypothetical protein
MYLMSLRSMEPGRGEGTCKHYITADAIKSQQRKHEHVILTKEFGAVA